MVDTEQYHLRVDKTLDLLTSKHMECSCTMLASKWRRELTFYLDKSPTLAKPDPKNTAFSAKVVLSERAGRVYSTVSEHLRIDKVTLF